MKFIRTIRQHLLKTRSIFLGEVTSVDFSTDGQCYLAGCSDSTVRLMENNTGEMLAE